MSTKNGAEEVLEADCFRQLVRTPPPASDVPAHLAWVRLMAQVLASLESWAPHFTTALLSHYRSLEGLRPFCETGEYERAYLDRVPHALNFLRYFMGSAEPQWLKDLARCETWSTALRGGVPQEQRGQLKEVLRIESRGDKEFARVSHDVLETLQHLTGFADTTMSRVGRLLWLLGVPPLYPVQRTVARPGLVVFRSSEGDVEMSYLPAEEPSSR
ncbi:hypothetical protein D187_001255 [Cystobacter fuscus DSM 2262]|uniref:Uncharacterized protein n=1 Tax=Cystobacter fuscus (strain ATCC 25194 / DSM 2262 / NBRC 100088 / M29) TaxID=1242864 RepID=S9PGE4_CYSF2|nr:hypothetical protein [Cystobacter fuscus]EPX61472.1 hypothetical protein D187_001255 [Cystobacter fuscus DSM 2262]